jgi:dUTP pyrophosphatase
VNETVRVRLLHPGAKLPTRATARSAGYDVYAAEAATIPGAALTPDGVEVGRGMVSTGLALAIPDGLYGRVAPRSGIAVRNGIDVGAGVIDPDYREELRVLLFNFAARAFEVRPGDRIAQLVFERVAAPAVEADDELDETGRAGGFGSTGMR